MKPIFQALSIFGFVAILFLLLVACASQADAAQPPTPTPTVDRLASPTMPPNPSQADLGSEVYRQVCMACHGDWGQGLTDEWREVWGEDSNCWNRKCHAGDYPDYGFEIYRDCCPAIIGTGTLTRFNNGLDLFNYNIENMPWWNPGYLTEDEFWQVTAFLMRANGALPEGVTLSVGNAAAFNLHPTSSLPGDKRPDVWFLAGILAAATVLLIFQSRLSR